jgi:hypothetical protein
MEDYPLKEENGKTILSAAMDSTDKFGVNRVVNCMAKD